MVLVAFVPELAVETELVDEAGAVAFDFGFLFGMGDTSEGDSVAVVEAVVGRN